MPLEDKAREVGRLIGQSDEYRAVTRANEGLASDADATAVLRKMEGLRREAQAMLQRGEEPTQDMEKQLDDLLTSVQGTQSYQRVAVAQENLDKIMRQVNDWISDGITKGSQSSIITLG